MRVKYQFVPAAAHRYINAAQLSRELEMSAYMLAKSINRGLVPKPDGFLAGKEIWNADRIPSIKEALARTQEVECQS
jgi:hypothetical protein